MYHISVFLYSCVTGQVIFKEQNIRNISSKDVQNLFKKKKKQLLAKSHFLGHRMPLETCGSGRLVNPYLEKGMAKEGWCCHLTWGPILGGQSRKSDAI